MTALSQRKPDVESYHEAEMATRQLREIVADQVHDLVIERDGLGTQGEFREAIIQIGRVGQELAQARGRQLQAREMGLPIAAHVTAEREALTLLRQTIMSACTAGASWVVALDVDAQRRDLNEPMGGRRRRQRETERI